MDYDWEEGRHYCIQFFNAIIKTVSCEDFYASFNDLPFPLQSEDYK